MKYLLNKNSFDYFKEVNNKVEFIFAFANSVIFIYLLFCYCSLLFRNMDLNGYHTLNSGMLSIPLIRFFALWLDIKKFKKLIPEIKQKYLEKKIEHDINEIYVLSTILIYILVILTCVFVIDWKFLGENGLQTSLLSGIKFLIINIVCYVISNRNKKRKS